MRSLGQAKITFSGALGRLQELGVPLRWKGGLYGGWGSSALEELSSSHKHSVCMQYLNHEIISSNIHIYFRKFYN